MLSSTKYVLVVWAVFASFGSSGQAQTSQASTSSQSTRIATSEQAIRAAKAACGLQSVESNREKSEEEGASTTSDRSGTIARETATQRTFDGSEVAFVGKSLSGRSGWRVRLIDIQLPVKSSTSNVALPLMNATVDLDSVSGAVVQIVLRTQAEEEFPSLAMYATAESATEKLSRGGNEQWQGLLDAAPQQTLDVVLGSIHKQTGIPIFKEARINVVRWSILGMNSRPAWSVHFRGFDVGFEPESGPTVDVAPTADQGTHNDLEPLVEETIVPLSMRNHLRHIVLDADARWVTAGTTPQPERLLESEVKKLEERLKTDKTQVPLAPTQGGK